MKIHWKEVLHVAAQIAPVILARTPLAALAPHVASGISLAQQAAEIAAASGQPMTSQAKLELAINEIRNGVLATNDQAGHELLKADDLNLLLAHAVSAVISGINAKTDVEGIINTIRAPLPPAEQAHTAP